MGCTAIQFAVAAGYEVIATASPANFELVKSLGATHVFDYRDPDIVGKIARLLKPGESIVDCIASTATQKTASEILSKIGGGKVGCLNPPEGSFADNVELIDGKSSSSTPQSFVLRMLFSICLRARFGGHSYR